jgi:hypothetical protein
MKGSTVNILAALIVAILALLSPAPAAFPPPTDPPTRTVPQRTESVCRGTFEAMCRIISDMHRRGEIDDDIRRALIQWAYQEYLACRAGPPRLPYVERDGRYEE